MEGQGVSNTSTRSTHISLKNYLSTSTHGGQTPAGEIAVIAGQQQTRQRYIISEVSNSSDQISQPIKRTTLQAVQCCLLAKE